jgi:hypothetical protein
MPQMYDPKDGVPKLSEPEVPAQQQMIDLVCKSPEQREAAQKALDARDIIALQKALWDWK